MIKNYQPDKETHNPVPPGDSENANVKNEKVKVTLSVHQVVNYTQEVEVTPEELEVIEALGPNKPVETFTEVHDIISERIDFKHVYSREEILDCEIIEKPEV